ncbi:putative mitochondrial protein, partial [Mucuna pruriens]
METNFKKLMGAKNRGTRHLSAQESFDRRERGLYFRCGQQFHPLHQRPDKQLRFTILAEYKLVNDQGEIELMKEEREVLNEDLSCSVMNLLSLSKDVIFEWKVMRIEGNVIYALNLPIHDTQGIGIRIGDSHCVFRGWRLWELSMNFRKGTELPTLQGIHPKPLQQAASLQSLVGNTVYDVDGLVWSMEVHCSKSDRPEELSQNSSLIGQVTMRLFFNQFIKGYGSVAKPSTELTKEDGFHWGFASQEAFDNLKHIMTNSPVLVLPNFTHPFEVDCDALGRGISAVLTQQRKPLA